MCDHKNNLHDDDDIIQRESSHQAFLLPSSLLGLVCEDKRQVGTPNIDGVNVNMCQC